MLSFQRRMEGKEQVGGGVSPLPDGDPAESGDRPDQAKLFHAPDSGSYQPPGAGRSQVRHSGQLPFFWRKLGSFQHYFVSGPERPDAAARISVSWSSSSRSAARRGSSLVNRRPYPRLKR